MYYDSPVTETKKAITYSQLQHDVARFAGVLARLGVTTGDRVVIYMPMVPEALIAMLACARIGAIHSVVFGGFAASELAVRLSDASPKVIVTATCGIEVAKVIPYMPIVNEAIEMADHKPQSVVVLERSQAEFTPFSSSATPITAHSATAGCAATISSISPVESRWPATLMTSSVRPITKI